MSDTPTSAKPIDTIRLERALVAFVRESDDPELIAEVGGLAAALRELAASVPAIVAERDTLRAEVKRLRGVAITGWESARLLAICPPTFGAPATEKAADDALADLRKGP
jgi:hypothetical protein